METFSALLAICAGNSPVPGEFPVQRPVTRSFDVFFDLDRNKRLSKQWWGWWFETPSSPLCRHCKDFDIPWDFHIHNRFKHMRYIVFYKLVVHLWRIYASVNWASIGLDNGLSPVQCQAITWSSADLLMGHFGTNFSEIWIEIQTFSLTKMRLKCCLQAGGDFVSDSIC